MSNEIKNNFTSLKSNCEKLLEFLESDVFPTLKRLFTLLLCRWLDVFLQSILVIPKASFIENMLNEIILEDDSKTSSQQNSEATTQSDAEKETNEHPKTPTESFYENIKNMALFKTVLPSTSKLVLSAISKIAKCLRDNIEKFENQNRSFFQKCQECQECQDLNTFITLFHKNDDKSLSKKVDKLFEGDNNLNFRFSNEINTILHEVYKDLTSKDIFELTGKIFKNLIRNENDEYDCTHIYEEEEEEEEAEYQ